MTSIPFFRSRHAGIVAAVLLLHALALWGLQSGLLQRVAALTDALVVPVTLVSELPSPAKPVPLQPAAVAAPSPRIEKPAPLPVTPAAAAPAAAPALAALPAIADASPAPAAPTGAQRAPVAAAAAAPAVPATRVELPSSDADYLHNPTPRYPGLSISRNEQGTVQLSVLVGLDGRAREVKIKVSSGYERLDRAAREAVLGWTFVPGKRAGVPEDMWYDLPMPFRLKE